MVMQVSGSKLTSLESLSLPLNQIILKKSIMTANTQHTTIADYDFGFLQFLHPDSKLDLIAKHSQSLKDNKQEPTCSLQSLFGAYKIRRDGRRDY
jgi:hypothetical protein